MVAAVERVLTNEEQLTRPMVQAQKPKGKNQGLTAAHATGTERGRQSLLSTQRNKLKTAQDYCSLSGKRAGGREPWSISWFEVSRWFVAR